jgi:hypothetical protein
MDDAGDWSAASSLMNDRPVLNDAGAAPVAEQPIVSQQSSTKRPRSPAAPPPPHHQPALKRNKKSSRDSTHSPDSTVVLATQLKNPTTRNQALQTLLQLSSNATVNYALDRDDNHNKAAGGAGMNDVLNALVEIVYTECLDYKTHVQNTQQYKQEKDKLVLSASQTWKTPPTRERAAWFQHVRAVFRQTPNHYHPKLLQTILIILRNFSFVSANIRVMRKHHDIWSILISCLYEEYSHERELEYGGMPTYNLALHALYTLLNMAQQPQLDVTGQLELCDSLFLDNAPLLQTLGMGGMQLARAFHPKDHVVDIPISSVMEIATLHLQQVWSLFSALAHVITNPTCPRLLLMMALDFLKECCNQVGSVVLSSYYHHPTDDDDANNNIPTMAAILRELPSEVIDKLIDCLWIPRLGPDALDYVNPVHTMVARVGFLKLRSGYDATVDTDLRDRALDVLVPWLSLDDAHLAPKLAFSHPGGGNQHKIQKPRFWNALVPILTTRVGRNDAPSLATQVLKYMASSSENQEGLLYIQEYILELASRDARIAQLAFTHLYRKESQVVLGGGGAEEVSDEEQEEKEEDNDEDGGTEM